MKRLDFLSLHCFLSVVRTGSIAAAARREDLATSALSKRVSDLEARLGVLLLERGSSGVRPTAAGEAVARRAERILDMVEGLERELFDHVEGVRGAVRLSAAPSTVSGLLFEDIVSFEKAFPEVRVTLKEATSLNIIQMVTEGVVDVGVAIDYQVPADLAKQHYANDPIWVMTPLGHPLMQNRAADAPVPFAEAVEFEIISQHNQASIETLVQAAASTLDQPLRKHFEVTQYDSLRRLVEAGLGIAFIRKSGVARYMGMMRIDGRPLAEPWAARELCVITRTGSGLSGATRALADHLARRSDRHPEPSGRGF